jgi:formylglycine-generating enzyme required for sulfatase activity
VITVDRWTGKEARALRLAKRMSLKAFAAHLGITDRQLSNWEQRGESITIREVNQAALDTSLKVSGPDVHERFEAFIGTRPSATAEQAAPFAIELSAAPHLRHPRDGKQMALVDEGSYLSGADNASIWLPSFYIDVFPVTNSEYAQFVGSTGRQPPDHWPRGKCPDALFDHPVTFVTWHDAATYAAWYGKELPTSQQWEKAARGTGGDTYPWGDQQTPAKCNTRENGIKATTPVSRYHSGTSIYGVYDLCGNVWEWCSTRTESGRYELKGGAFTSPFIRATPASFNDADSAMLDDDTGFRCSCPAQRSPRPSDQARPGWSTTPTPRSPPSP